MTSQHRESSPRQAAPRASAPPLCAGAAPWVSEGARGLPPSSAIRPLRHRIRPGLPPAGKRGLPPAYTVRHRGRLRYCRAAGGGRVSGPNMAAGE